MRALKKCTKSKKIYIIFSGDQETCSYLSEDEFSGDVSIPQAVALHGPALIEMPHLQTDDSLRVSEFKTEYNKSF
jgi:hypothetical protein